MKKYTTALQTWIKERSQREQIYLFMGSLACIYLIYFLVFLRPVLSEKKMFREQMTALKTEQAVTNQQINKINEAVKSPLFAQMIMEKNKLSQQLDELQKQIDNLKPNLLSGEELSRFTKTVLRHDGQLISVEALPIEPWPPQEDTTKTNKNNTSSPLSISGYQHTLRVEFQNDYFQTMAYLSMLEKHSKRIYWDSMEYKVTKYPKANIVIKLHVISLRPS